MGARALKEPVGVCPGLRACGEDMAAASLLPRLLKINISTQLNFTSVQAQPSLWGETLSSS